MFDIIITAWIIGIIPAFFIFDFMASGKDVPGWKPLIILKMALLWPLLAALFVVGIFVILSLAIIAEMIKHD